MCTCDRQRSEKAYGAIVHINRFFKDGICHSAIQNAKHIALGKFSIDFSEEGFDPVGNVAARTQRTCEVNSTSTASLLVLHSSEALQDLVHGTKIQRTNRMQPQAQDLITGFM
ncbi:unnamed protein product [Musa hybrid cultivar]